MSSAGEDRAGNGQGRTRKLGFLQYVGYGVGDTANNLTFSMVSSFLLLYYTDVAGIPAAAAGPCLLFLTGMFAAQTVAVYYARDVLGNASYYIVMTVVGTVLQIVASVVVPGAARAIGKKRAYILGGFIAVVGGVAMAFAPGTVPAVGIACYGVLYFGLGLVNTLILAIQPDTVDYGEWKTGVRGEGSAYSVLSFTRKVGQGVGVPRPRSPSGSEATCRRGGPEGRRRAGDLDTTDGRGGDMTPIGAGARRSAGDRRRGVRGASARRQVVRALHAWDAEVFRRTAGRRPWPWSCRR